MASFYALGFNGRLTSFGEKFNVHELTAAHRKLPYNTIVKVTNVSNNKYVIVRINDRGPHTKNRILDLSPAAAEKLDMIKKGIAKVTVEVIIPQQLATDSLNIIDGFRNNYDIYHYKIGRTYDVNNQQKNPEGYCIQVLSTDVPDSATICINNLKNSNYQVFTQVISENKKIKYIIKLGAFPDEQQAIWMSDSLKKQGIIGLIKKNTAIKNGN